MGFFMCFGRLIGAVTEVEVAGRDAREAVRETETKATEASEGIVATSPPGVRIKREQKNEKKKDIYFMVLTFFCDEMS